ncbi:MAG TPA: hypothetical protein VJV05_06225 [Pyrinomonadaceae bacterium]|nr:hypothetical protein [Pyrinomonadaceae bacterium]
MSIGGELNRDRFAGALGTTFTLTTADGKSIPLELVEVSDLHLRPDQVSYSILFRFPEGYPVQQGLHNLQHPAFGRFQLLLVPVITPAAQLRLEALFNFIVPNSSTTGQGG